ncbi:FYN-binding protein 1 isoform X3 [Kryptolebias marmoratus]|uniref:FYN-binding protein 1 isoform X3 n=1 Tax=Kryptolebias marmoratus TaxID=37003 RepID=UPI0018ACB809|nr:FYN-binding protein 1 isoform X3 [Kryptolebias marmoratus]
MDEDGPIDFKALRAKFQKEGLLSQWKTSRPAVAEKPKHILSPGGHCSSLTSPSSQPANGDGTAMQSLRGRNMPLVLPVLPLKDQRMDITTEREHKLELEPGKEVSPQNKFKKRGMLLPFKSVKATKVSAEDGEGPAGLTNRSCSSPGELPSAEKQGTEDRVSVQSEHAASEHSPSSPEILISPPPSESHVDSGNSNVSTVERTKKKFSRRQMLISAKTKILRSPDKTFPSPLKNPDSLGTNVLVPPAVCLPHLACISARPFSKASSSPWKPAFDFQLVREKVEQLSARTAELNPPNSPLKKPLPELGMLGPMPAKPSRPPVVDITAYLSLTVKGAPSGQCQTPHKECSEPTFTSNPVLDAPQFPEFENSEVEPAVGEAVDIAALDLEALDIVCSDVKTPIQFEEAGRGAPEPDRSVQEPAETCEISVVRDLNLGSPNIIPLDPACFPEPINLSEFPELPLPEQQSQSDVLAVDTFANSYETDVGTAESQSLPEETELRSHTSNDEIQTHLKEYQQDNHNETSDDVYEEVESINKFISGQISTKQRSKLKNPYADNHPMKEEVYVNRRPRHPWGSITGEHAAHAAHRAHSKEQSSPNSAVYKDQRKREKQRLEKERKEQKEREKKENEMKKKFKVTGSEEPLYHAKVMVASKVRKNDLPVKSGDTVSIIRTTNCPKGKWLAQDANHKYGYISVMNVELNIKEMLELGKKAQTAGRGGNVEADTISIGSRSSTYPVLTSSFCFSSVTDDSEEWAYEDDTLSPSSESHIPPQQTASEPEMSYVPVDAQQTLSDANLEDLHTQIRHEALQKLAFFLQANKNETGDVSVGGGATPKYRIPHPSLLTISKLLSFTLIIGEGRRGSSQITLRAPQSKHCSGALVKWKTASLLSALSNPETSRCCIFHRQQFKVDVTFVSACFLSRLLVRR